MAIPVVTQPTTPRTIAQGIAIPALTLVASGTPTEWAASPLPDGLALDDETGVITGTPTAAGLVETEITATNGDGTSAPVSLVWNVQAQPTGAGEWSDLELDFDLVTRRVTIPGVEQQAGQPLFSVARGDKFNLLVGIVKWGVLRDVKPGSETVAVKLALKEFAPELNLTLSGAAAAPTKVGTGDLARFRVPCWIDPSAWAVLGDYEADRKTGLLAVGEMELTVGTAAALYDETETDDLDLYGGIGEGGYFDAALETTLVFTGLSDIAGAGYTLSVSLVVTGRAGQNVGLNFTLDIAKPGAVWVVSNLTGDDTIQGAVEGDAWRVTLEVTDVAGDADSVDVDVRITTTLDGEDTYTFELPVGQDLTSESTISFSPEPSLYLYDSGDTEIGAEALAASYDDGAALLAALADAWDAAAGVAEVVSVTAKSGTPTTAVFVVAGTTDVRSIGLDSVDPPGTTYEATQTPGIGDSAEAVLTGQLTQVATEGDQPLRFTSLPIDIEVIADNVPDE